VYAGLFSFGVPESAVMAGGVEILSFGPRKLPEIGKGFGKTVKSFSQVKNPLPPQGLLLCKLFEAL
jgi:sec-independent protein translocase protein TatA